MLSDDKAASKKISAFAESADRWMVAVRMVSEGVDIPRLAVGVYATSVSTALFFAQAVGRFVRARQRGETASVFLPSVPVLLSYAAELEAERDHILRAPGEASEEDDLLAEAQRQRDNPDTSTSPPSSGPQRLRALRPGAVRRRRVRHGHRGGFSRGGGLPRPARPARTGPGADLLRKRQDAQLATRSKVATTPPCRRPIAGSRPRLPRVPARRAALAGRRGRVPKPRRPLR